MAVIIKAWLFHNIYVNPPSTTHLIRKRVKEDKRLFTFIVYCVFSLQTYVGDILVALNPFKDIGIYDKNVSYA